MSLCKCSGTTGLVHISCLDHWLNAQNVDHCDRCHHRFPTAAQATCIHQFFHWALPTDSPSDVQGDRFCFALMTPMAALGGFFCVLDAFKQVLTGQIMGVISVVTLAGLLITAYLFWCVFTVHFDYRAFALWQTTESDAQNFGTAYCCAGICTSQECGWSAGELGGEGGHLGCKRHRERAHNAAG
ncbi:hypothetical protein MRX96_056823 [Rhipicephalus microplus]